MSAWRWTLDQWHDEEYKSLKLLVDFRMHFGPRQLAADYWPRSRGVLPWLEAIDNFRNLCKQVHITYNTYVDSQRVTAGGPSIAPRLRY